jgi:hypothetical protein
VRTWRLSDALIERIGRGQKVGAIVASSLGEILVGAGAYGLAFGAWRAPEQALFAALKLPALMVGVVLGSIGVSSMLAMLLGTRLSLRQTAMCMLISLAVTSTLLGALAPVGIAIDLCVAPRTPAAGHALLLLHTTLVAAAGAVGVVRLRRLLARLGLGATIARRVLVSWVGAQFLVGSQLCWLLRPFFGDLAVRPTFFATGVLDGNFFQAVITLGRATFGSAALPVLGLVLGGLLVLLQQALCADVTQVKLDVGPRGVGVTGETQRFLRPSDIASVRVEADLVVVELAADETLKREALRVLCASPEDAAALGQRLERARMSADLGPFRSQAL